MAHRCPGRDYQTSYVRRSSIYNRNTYMLLLHYIYIYIHREREIDNMLLDSRAVARGWAGGDVNGSWPLQTSAKGSAELLLLLLVWLVLLSLLSLVVLLVLFVLSLSLVVCLSSNCVIINTMVLAPANLTRRVRGRARAAGLSKELID